MIRNIVLLLQSFFIFFGLGTLELQSQHADASYTIGNYLSEESVRFEKSKFFNLGSNTFCEESNATICDSLECNDCDDILEELAFINLPVKLAALRFTFLQTEAWHSIFSNGFFDPLFRPPQI